MDELENELLAGETLETVVRAFCVTNDEERVLVGAYEAALEGVQESYKSERLRALAAIGAACARRKMPRK